MVCILYFVTTGLNAGVIVQKHKTAVDARLQEITIIDPTPQALHPRVSLLFYASTEGIMLLKEPLPNCCLLASLLVEHFL